MRFPFLVKPNPSAMFASVARTQDRKIVIQFSRLNKLPGINLDYVIDE